MPRLCLLLPVLLACSVTPPSAPYTVRWPSDWVTADLTQNSTAAQDYRQLVSYIGGRPKGQSVLFQHAVVVSAAPFDTVIADIKARQLDRSNAELVEETRSVISSHPAFRLVFRNRVDPANQSTYPVTSDEKYHYVLHLHAPNAGNPALDQAASLLTSSFEITP